jgi:thiopeptide-type bacteriocin biosynthesis protein
LLDCFTVSAEDKLSLLQQLRDAFAAEFNLDKTLKTQLNDKYRNNKTVIEAIMEIGGVLPANWYPLTNILAENATRCRLVAGEINALSAAGKMEIPLFSLLGSYIHMLINRIATSEARIHELVIYDFLCRCYKARSYSQSNDLCNRF